MNCPSCNARLKMSERHGVEVNYCPGCRGVWIDHGGLDQIIDRSRIGHTPESRFGETGEHPEHGDRQGVGGHRRRSFFSDLFG